MTSLLCGDKRRSVREFGEQLLEQNLTTGAGGNVSARDGDHVAISPSGVPYPEITAETVPVVTVNGEQVAGDLAPSSETPMHTSIYRARDDIGGIVHTHSPFASTFAALGREIPPSHYLVAMAGPKIPVAGYAPPGTEELASYAVDTLSEEYSACLLKNHGVMAVGETLGDAFETALMVEYCAQIHYQASAIGEPEQLTDEQMATLGEVFESYGMYKD